MSGAEEEKSGGSKGHGGGDAGKGKEGEVAAAAAIPKEIHEVPTSITVSFPKNFLFSSRQMILATFYRRLLLLVM